MAAGSVQYDVCTGMVLSPRQVHTMFVDGLCNYAACYNACCKQPRGKIIMLSGVGKQMLISALARVSGTL